MSFLHGVLDNIQPKLGLHKDDVQTAIESLNANKHRGKEGFNDAIGKVVEGVKEYNESVKASNKKVSEQIKLLQGQVGENFKNTGRKIDYNDKKQRETVGLIDSKLEECKNNASAFVASLSTHSETIDNFNNTLCNRVRVVKNNVEHEKGRLHNVAAKEKENLDALQKNIESALSEVKCNVNKKIEADVRRLVRELKEALKPILQALQKLSKELRQHVVALGKWIGDADSAVQKALAHVEKIIEEVDGSNKSAIDQAIQQIEGEAGVLHFQFEQLRDKYNDVVAKVKGQDGDGKGDCAVKKLSEVENEVRSKVPGDFKTFNDDSVNNVWNMKYLIDFLTTQIEGNVKWYVGTLASALRDAVKKANPTFVRGHIPGLKALQGTDLWTLPKFGGRLEMTVGLKGVDGLGANLERFLSNLNSAKNAWDEKTPAIAASSIYQEIVNGLGEAIGKKATDVNDRLFSLLQTAAFNGINAAQVEVKKIVSEHLDAIQKLDGRLEGEAYAAQNAILVQASAVTHTLKALCAEIKNAAQLDKDSAKSKLEELKSKFFAQSTDAQGSINKIHSDISKLQKELDSGPIHNLKYFLDHHADKTCQNIIGPLNKSVNREITDAETKMVSNARKQYVMTIKFLVQQFVEKVTSELDGLPTQISEDLEKGHKKFMKLFETEFCTKAEEIKRIDPKILTKDNSPLSQAATKFRAALSSFFIKFKQHSEFTSDSEKIRPSRKALDTLLEGPQYSRHFDHKFSTNLEKLNESLTEFNPKSYGEGTYSYILEGFRKGFSALAGEMEKAYVSTYSGAAKALTWDENSDEFEKCPSVCVTTISTFYEQLFCLFYNSCMEWRNFSVDGTATRGTNRDELKEYLTNQGYEIQNLKKDKTGRHVKDILSKAFQGHEFRQPPNPAQPNFAHYLHSIRKSEGILCKLHSYADLFYRGSHLTHYANAKLPCTIRDIMSWFCGLQYRPVYEAFRDKYYKLVMKNEETDPIMKLNNSRLLNSLSSTMTLSSTLLLTICGTGRGAQNAAYPYAMDWSNNHGRFYYPSGVDELMDTMKYLVSRLHTALVFLYHQCRLTVSQANGWRDCKYGRDVMSTKLPCKNHASNESECQPRSPLQSYLSDSLLGQLPHQLTTIGCKTSCGTCPRLSPGQQCVTPMGFWDISTSASISGTGRDICEILDQFCKEAESPLPSLYRCLMSLKPQPPKTLHEMFGLYYNLLRCRAPGKYADNLEFTAHLENKIIPKVSIFLSDNTQTKGLTNALSKLHNSDHDHIHSPKPDAATKTGTHSDLSSVTVPSNCTKSLTCAYYLQPSCFDAYHTFPQKHAEVYFSWFLYLAWDFHELLKSLFEAFCGIDCKSSGCSSCNCLTGKHGVSEPKSEPKAQPIGQAIGQAKSEPNAQPKPGCHCLSMVQCSGVQPTLFRYGFTFGNPERLMNGSSRKTCDNFCAQLKKVIESEHFRKLFKVIDEFIWTIRTPFSYLLLALWSLSLLYLLHIAVVRLDVLRIRSHLKSPSSHRIAAQSLLAAARVRALANVKYFSP
ncbi:hypothetical protein, conserved [Babesia ovata]|uniref:Extracellular matrix-binding ebh n=1 Tax=Babesia ovata TaxID=189622 RepID=A0A2H6KJH1_9APIC|nr:uncharacterized protein BOVATA_046290 [Babesia ovata]GBE63136.1 hypothetical protein, conserved [Babesia ovata]